MKIKVTSGYYDKEEYRSIYEIEIDGKKEVHFLDGELEDANLNRDFRDVYNIPALMKAAWEAGRKLEDFEVQEIEYKEE